MTADVSKSDLPEGPLRLVLVTPEIPANTGNVARLCAVTGVSLHLIEPLGFSLDDRLTRRAGLDYWRDCRLSTHLTFEELERAWPQAGFHFLTTHARTSFFDRAVSPGDVLVLGCESAGLGSGFLNKNKRHERACHLPMPGRGRSLNLSTAAGVVVYEALRQLGLLTQDPRGGEPCPP